MPREATDTTSQHSRRSAQQSRTSLTEAKEGKCRMILRRICLTRESLEEQRKNILCFFGLIDDVSLLLWKDAFIKRAEIGLVGLNIRHAVTFNRYILPPEELTMNTVGITPESPQDTTRKAPIIPGTGKLRRYAETHQEEDQQQSDSEEEEKEEKMKGFAYGNDAYKFYRRLIAAELEVTQSNAGQTESPISLQAVAKYGLGSRFKPSPLDVTPEEKERFNIAAFQRRRPLLVMRPYFILTITAIQLLTLIVILGAGGIAKVGLVPKIELLVNVDTLSGHQTIDYWYTPNMWIGPHTKFLIGNGAVFGPCMRKDLHLIRGLLHQGFKTSDLLGCCHNDLRDIAATTTKEECAYLSFNGASWETQVCERYLTRIPKHWLRPCCYGFAGKCFLSNRRECDFLSGTWYPDLDHCIEVNCFQNSCGRSGISSSKEAYFLPTSVTQSWRLFVSIIYHAGIIHYLINIILQWLLGRPLEEMVGWIRMAALYLMSGLGGNMTAALFDPYSPHIGANGSIAGIISIHLIELIQKHKIVKRPIQETIGIFFILFFMFFLGTFPYLNNFVHLGGLVFGAVTGTILMPHICFGIYNTGRRRKLILSSSIILITLLIIVFSMFYWVQDVGLCQDCNMFSCIPYGKHMCNETANLETTTYIP